MSSSRWFGQISKYFLKNLLYMVLLFVLPVNLLVGWLFSYQNQTMMEQRLLKGSRDIERIHDQCDNLLVTAQRGNIAASTSVNAVKLARLTHYEFNLRTNETIKMLQAESLSMETANRIVDKVTYHFRVPSLYVSSTSAWTDALPNRALSDALPGINYANAYLYRLVEKYEREGLIQSTEYDRDTLTFFTNIFFGNVLCGGVAFKCSVPSLLSALSESNDLQSDRLLIASSEGTVILDSGRELVGRSMSSIMAQAQRWPASSEKRGRVIFSGQHYAMLTTASDSGGWQYYLLCSLAELDRAQRVNTAIMAALSLGMTLAMIAIAFWLAMKFYRPVRVIVEMLADPGMTMSKQYELLAQRVDELGIVAEMLQKSRIDMLMTEHMLLDQQKQLEQIENQALRSQINPHFIYNTLESINWKIRAHLGLNNEASEMITDLSKLLRLTFRSRERFVPLHEELAHAQVYMRLQKVRFRDKFDMTWEIDEAMLDRMVLPLLLQPLLENAITHGCAPELERTVHIRCACQAAADGALLLIVADDGIGMMEEALAKVQGNLSDAETDERDNAHIGLSNTNRRMALMYGEKYTIQVESAHHRGTKVTLTIP